MIRQRGYKPIEFSNALYRPINPDLRLGASRNEHIKVRVVEKNEADLWSQTNFEGWSEFPEYADFFKELSQVIAHSKGPLFLAELEGEVLAQLLVGGNTSRCRCRHPYLRSCPDRGPGQLAGRRSCSPS